MTPSIYKIKTPTYVSICWIFLLFFIGSNLQAQQITQDVVELKNGTILKGEILTYNKGGQLKIKIEGGSILVYEAKEVQKISRAPILNLVVTKRKGVKTTFPVDDVPQKGFHPMLSGATLAGRSREGNLDVGLQIDFVAWYRIQHWLVVGVGAGFAASLDWYTLPIYASIRSYLNNKSGSFFGELSIGYAQMVGIGLNFPPASTDLLEGGWYLRPAIGYQFPSKRKTHVGLDIGFGINSYIWGYRPWEIRPITNMIGTIELGAYQEVHGIDFNPSIRLNILF